MVIQMLETRKSLRIRIYTNKTLINVTPYFPIADRNNMLPSPCLPYYSV